MAYSSDSKNSAENKTAGTQGTGKGTGCICLPQKPFLVLLMEKTAEKIKTGKGGNVLVETAKEWWAQHLIIR